MFLNLQLYGSTKAEIHILRVLTKKGLLDCCYPHKEINISCFRNGPFRFPASSFMYFSYPGLILFGIDVIFSKGTLSLSLDIKQVGLNILWWVTCVWTSHRASISVFAQKKWHCWKSKLSLDLSLTLSLGVCVTCRRPYGCTPLWWLLFVSPLIICGRH